MGVSAEGATGVGGAFGRKKAGTEQTDDCTRDIRCRSATGRVGRTHNYGNVEHHARHVARFVHPERHDKLAQGGTEGVSQTHDSCSCHTTAMGEPQIRVSSRRSQDKGLAETRQDLTEHDHAESASRGQVSACETDPVADQKQAGRGDHRVLRPEVQHIDDDGGNEGEGKERSDT